MQIRPFIIRLKLFVILISKKSSGCSEEMEIYSLFGRRGFNLFPFLVVGASIYFPYLGGRTIPSVGVNTQVDYVYTHGPAHHFHQFSASAIFISFIVNDIITVKSILIIYHNHTAPI